jgi:hypothetical protein
LAGLPVGPPLRHRCESGAEPVGVGVGVLGYHGADALVVGERDAEPDRGAEVEQVHGVPVDAEGVDDSGGDLGEAIEGWA